ncbi:MAG: hypothetical protein IKA22_00860 [Lentisphaeria bacterium]|nr:hypothetical protein [Lentisphaeria bacterium]
MAEKKQHGGDWFDKIQAHNRNVALDRQARAAEETARQAEIDRRQNEQHRRRLEELEEKRATDEAARLRLVQDEQEKKEIAKYENTKIYNLFRRLKEIEVASTPGQKYLLIRELKNEAEAIDLEAVLDISYKDRFFETIDALKIALDKLYAECGKNATFFKEYEAVMEKSKDEISSLSEIRSFENVVESLKIFPELLTPVFDDYRKRINVFLERASKAKSFFEIFKSKSPELCHDRLKGAIASKYNIPTSIFSEEDYDSLETLSIENENLEFVKEAMMEVVLDDSIPSEELQPLFDFLAEQSSTTKIVIETYRREKALEKLAQDIAKKKEQKELNEMRAICKLITTPEIMLKFDIPNDDDVENSVVAKAWHKTLGTIYTVIIFYRDHVRWLTDNKSSFSVSWDDLVHSWERDFKKGGFIRLPEFRGHKIHDNRCVELFERLIAYKKSIIEQQEKSIIPTVVVSGFDEESSENPTEKDSGKNNLPDDTMGLFFNVDDPHIFMNPNIPPTKLRNALESYAPGIAPADVLVLIDDTVFGGAKEGMIITKRKLFSKQILQSPIASELVAETKISLVRDRELHIDGRKVHVFITPKKNSLPQLIEAIEKMCQS